MERWKQIGKRLLWPGAVLSVLIPLVVFSLLAAVFYFGLDGSPVGYCVYVLSVYALAVLILGLIPLVGKGIRFYRIRKAGVRDLKRKSLLASLSINLIYALFNLVTGLYYGNIWLISNGIYYLILSLIRLLLYRYELRQNRITDPKEKLLLSWKGFRACGWMLFALNLPMAGMVIQMIWDGMGSRYSELVVYAVAAYTFYRLTAAIIRVSKTKDNTGPIDGAAQNISLTAAIMAMYSLQTAMLSAFGEDPEYELLMNRLSGGAVCVLVLLGALGMVFHGRKRIRQLHT